MRRTIVLTLGCLAMLVPGLALAKKTRKLAVTSIASSIAPNQAPTLLAGNLKGSLGPGGVVIKFKSAKGNTATLTFEAFTEHGAIKGIVHVTLTSSGPNGPGGTTFVKGRGSITGGTGLYKGGTGSFKVTGESPPGQSYYQLSLNGSITLP